MILITLLVILPHVLCFHLPIHKQNSLPEAKIMSHIPPCEHTSKAIYIDKDIRAGHACLQLNLLLQQIGEVARP
jgi:hypothetical protein